MKDNSKIMIKSDRYIFYYKFMKNENCDKVISQNITINSILYVSTSMHYDDRTIPDGELYWQLTIILN